MSGSSGEGGFSTARCRAGMPNLQTEEFRFNAEWNFGVHVHPLQFCVVSRPPATSVHGPAKVLISYNAGIMILPNHLIIGFINDCEEEHMGVSVATPTKTNGMVLCAETNAACRLFCWGSLCSLTPIYACSLWRED
jgi:hypothetical protein